jgi:hypothetical protein
LGEGAVVAKIRPAVIRPACGGIIELSRYKDGSVNLMVADVDSTAIVRLAPEEALMLLGALFGIRPPQTKPTRTRRRRSEPAPTTS